MMCVLGGVVGGGRWGGWMQRFVCVFVYLCLFSVYILCFLLCETEGNFHAGMTIKYILFYSILFYMCS